MSEHSRKVHKSHERASLSKLGETVVYILDILRMVSFFFSKIQNNTEVKKYRGTPIGYLLDNSPTSLRHFVKGCVDFIVLCRSVVLYPGVQYSLIVFSKRYVIHKVI